jgi:hypothetical protein
LKRYLHFSSFSIADTYTPAHLTRKEEEENEDYKVTLALAWANHQPIGKQLVFRANGV